MNLLSWFLVRMLCPGLNTPREPDPRHPSLHMPSHSTSGHSSPHLMNFRAKDLSFPVAAAAASSKSRLFPDSMCPSTPRSPSGDLEWSASIVWGQDRKSVKDTEDPQTQPSHTFCVCPLTGTLPL